MDGTLGGGRARRLDDDQPARAPPRAGLRTIKGAGRARAKIVACAAGRRASFRSESMTPGFPAFDASTAHAPSTARPAAVAA